MQSRVGTSTDVGVENPRRDVEATGDPVPAPGTTAVAVSIVVPCYNNASFLDSCLTSIYSHPPSRTFEVLVIDDASSDGCSELARSRFPQARLFTNLRNLGYAQSSNLGVQASLGEYVYLLNSDVQVLPGAIDDLVEFLESSKDAGAAASLLYNGDGSVQASIKALPSMRSALFGARSLLSQYWPDNRFTRQELLHWRARSGEAFTAGYVSSASLMVRREVFRRLGGLDSGFFYFLDADFCKRIWDARQKVYCVPRAAVIHHEHRGGSLASLKRRLNAIGNFHWGAYRYFRKHVAVPAWHPMHFLAIAGLLARFVTSGASQILREILGIERRREQEAQPLSDEERRRFRPLVPRDPAPTKK